MPREGGERIAQTASTGLRAETDRERRKVEWTISDFSELLEQCPKGQCIVSPEFCAGGITGGVVFLSGKELADHRPECPLLVLMSRDPPAVLRHTPSSGHWPVRSPSQDHRTRAWPEACISSSTPTATGTRGRASAPWRSAYRRRGGTGMARERRSERKRSTTDAPLTLPESKDNSMKRCRCDRY